MNLAGVGPAGEAGHHVELAEQLGDYLFGVGFFGESIEVGDDFQEGGFDVLDGLCAVILALGLQALMMLEKFFAIELGQH